MNCRDNNRLKKGVFNALMALKPSIIVLTEYVVKDGDHQHADLCDRLETAGFYHELSDATTGNRVLIASSMQLHRGSTVAPPSIPFAAANYLHVTMQTLDVVGLRVPYFDNSKTWKDAKIAYDQWFETNLKSLLALDKPLIAIGPLSYINPERLDDSYNATLFRDVIDAGWLISRLSERTEQLVAREESFTHAR
jgi:exonuclease III